MVGNWVTTWQCLELKMKRPECESGNPSVRDGRTHTQHFFDGYQQKFRRLSCPSPAGWTEDCACQWSTLRWVTAPVDDCLQILSARIVSAVIISWSQPSPSSPPSPSSLLPYQHLPGTWAAEEPYIFNLPSSLQVALVKELSSSGPSQIKGWSYTLNLHIMYQAHFQLRTPVHHQVWTRHPQVSS